MNSHDKYKFMMGRAEKELQEASNGQDILVTITIQLSTISRMIDAYPCGIDKKNQLIELVKEGLKNE